MTAPTIDFRPAIADRDPSEAVGAIIEQAAEMRASDLFLMSE
jgi:hypothetical protein